MKRIVTPSQTVGPYLKMVLEEVAPLGSQDVPGERITITGRLLDGEGKGVNDGMIETWQANARGKYAHPEDFQDKQTTPGFTGFGRVWTDPEGGFRFETIKPGPVPWNDVAPWNDAGPWKDTAPRNNSDNQAPHIVVSVFARGLLKHLVTRIYFQDDPLLADDPVLKSVKVAARRETLLAVPDSGNPGAYLWDIVLQGPRETVFFDC